MCAKSKEERLAAFKNMAEADPENELAHFSLGKVHLELNNLSEAEASLRRTLELKPEHSLAHRFLGEALLRQARNDEAVKLLERGVLLAHEKGEWKPRNEMQDLLKEAGVEPPPLPAAEREKPVDSGASTAEPGAFVCRRCGRDHPPIDAPPFPNELGREVKEKICQVCWREWVAVSIKVINEYRLNLMLPEAQETYDMHLKEFLGL